MILQQEMALAKARRCSISWPSACGPTIIAYGTTSRRSVTRPRLLSCEEIWCQGYSEPNAGSDWRRSRPGRKDGEHYVINGQKVWTSLVTSRTG